MRDATQDDRFRPDASPAPWTRSARMEGFDPNAPPVFYGTPWAEDEASGPPVRFGRTAAIVAGWVGIALAFVGLCGMASSPSVRYEIARWATFGHPHAVYAIAHLLGGSGH